MEMKQLIEAVIGRLRDPAELVAKTAKKLLLELQKCYPAVFKENYIDSLSNEDERLICSLILENNFEEATKLIMSTSPSKRMAYGAQTSNNSSAPLQQAMFNPPGAEQMTPNSMSRGGSEPLDWQQTNPSQQHNFGAIGKAIVPSANMASPVREPSNQQ